MKHAILVCFVIALSFQGFATPSEAASPAGKWKGGWTSDQSGHAGPMRARIRQTGPDTYRAIFVGRFAKVIPFVYPAKLERVPGSRSHYTSSQRLPLLGVYQMNATVTSSQFQARFRGRSDGGNFRMSRR